MLANGVKQTTTTTGTGLNLTLAAEAGYPSLFEVLGLNRRFEYVGLDSDGLFKEAGIGYLSAPNTMVRARICATFIGGVYNAANPTASNLTGTTTIICTPHAASLESMLPTVDGVSAGVNRWLTSAARTGYSGATLAALRAYYVPFLLRVGAPIASLSVAVTVVGAAGTVARAGIYSGNENGYIGSLLATTADLDTGTTGNKTGTLSAPVFLPSGWYWTAIISSGSPSVQGYTSNSANMLGCSPAGFNTASPPLLIDFRSEVLGAAVLPATAGQSTSANAVGISHAPVVFLGVA